MPVYMRSALQYGQRAHVPRSVPLFFSSASAAKPRKPGVATDEEMVFFLEEAQDESITVVDTRNTDFSVEPGDEKWGSPDTHGPIAGTEHGSSVRPTAVNLTFDRVNKSMNLEAIKHLPKDAPIITHCGAGGRGQKGKDFLVSQGYTNVINGGGPSVKPLWDMYGHL